MKKTYDRLATGDRIRQKRNLLGFTQDEMAEKIESLTKLKKDTKVKVLGKGLFQYEQIYIVEYNSKRGFMFPDSLKKGATSNRKYKIALQGIKGAPKKNPTQIKLSVGTIE